MLNTIWALMILIGVAVGICTGTMEEIGNGALEAAGSAVTLCITMLGILSMWTGLMQVARASGLLERMASGLSPVIRFLFPKLAPDSKAAEYIATNMVANVLGLGWAATPAGIKAMEELAALEEERGTPGYTEKKILEKDRGKRKRKTEGRLAGKTEGRLEGKAEGRLEGKAEGRLEGKTEVKSERKPERKTEGKPDTADGDKNTETVEREASTEMCTLLVLNMSSLQLIPINMIAYRSQYGSASPAAIVAPVIAATVISTAVAVVFCRIMQWRERCLEQKKQDNSTEQWNTKRSRVTARNIRT